MGTIVGLFKSQEQAEQAVLLLQDQGYEPTEATIQQQEGGVVLSVAVGDGKEANARLLLDQVGRGATSLDAGPSQFAATGVGNADNNAVSGTLMGSGAGIPGGGAGGITAGAGVDRTIGAAPGAGLATALFGSGRNSADDADRELDNNVETESGLADEGNDRNAPGIIAAPGGVGLGEGTGSSITGLPSAAAIGPGVNRDATDTDAGDDDNDDTRRRTR